MTKKDKKQRKIRRTKNLLLLWISSHLSDIDRRLIDIRDKSDRLKPDLDIKEFVFKRKDDGFFEVKFNITDCGNGTIGGDFWTCLGMIQVWRKWGADKKECQCETPKEDDDT
ncbi:MAG: hypothetical protein GY870_12590 [archaeon]|nr:hypothetical protein [archaeon]